MATGGVAARVPGSVVLGSVILCYGFAIGLALRPREWQSNGEVHEIKYGEWKRSWSCEREKRR
ncbi:hypothetical protein [Halalkalicoccus ordinarius]|uniref:hypothetical protein n=1 Tax=Halalkalicoccus ordinarius TaxID=3116651 RepID=UPI00300E8014